MDNSIKSLVMDTISIISMFFPRRSIAVHLKSPQT